MKRGESRGVEEAESQAESSHDDSETETSELKKKPREKIAGTRT